MEIKLLKCASNGGKNKCKNQTEIDKFFEPLKFSFAFINQYFDFSDYEDPVKTFIDDSLFF